MVELQKKEAKLYMIIFHSSSERIESIHRVNRLMYVNTCNARYSVLNDFVKKKFKYK